VDKHADLLRLSVAHAGNDHRLGANEAPPAIISIYLGEQLSEVVDALIAGTPRANDKAARTMRLGVNTLPPLPRDATDRNRTSPFAFTGNKFEFRAVGSSQAIARPNIFLNTIVADSLQILADEIDKHSKEKGREAAVQHVVQTTLKQHKRVIFNGNGYAPEWQAEAERRGLPNFRNAVDAIARYAAADNVAVFERQRVLSAKEAESRMHIMFEAYTKAIAVEAQTALSIAGSMILPVALKHQEQAAKAVAAARAAGVKDLSGQDAHLRNVSTRIESLLAGIDALQKAFDHAEKHSGSVKDHATTYRDDVVPAVAKLRDSVDALEVLVDDELWPLPKYREMLFVH
jgi:glutamine synthetase